MTRGRNPKGRGSFAQIELLAAQARQAAARERNRTVYTVSCNEKFPGCDGRGCHKPPFLHPKAAVVAADRNAPAAHIEWAGRYLHDINAFRALAARADLPEHIVEDMLDDPVVPDDDKLVFTGSLGDRIEALTNSAHMTPARLRQVCAWNSLDRQGADIVLPMLGTDGPYILIAAQPHNRYVLDAVDAAGEWNARVAAALGRGAIIPGSAAKLRRNVAEVGARFGRGNPSVPIVMAGIADGWNGTVAELISATKLIMSLDL